jgi:hypothetical protein
VSISEEHQSAAPAAAAGTGRAPAAVDRARRWWVVAAATAALVAVLCVRNRFLLSTRLYEDADMGANSILIEQARHFTLLVGNYSRDKFHHPGPAYMYVQAAGESLFWAWLHVVPTAWNGQLLATYLLTSLFLALVVGVGYGWTRSLRGAAACFAVVAAFAAVHPGVLSTDWMPYMYVAAYVAFIAAAGSVVAGRAQDAWVMTLTGWFLIHGHACFLLFVPLITCVVLAAVLWPRRPRRVRGGGQPFPRGVRGDGSRREEKQGGSGGDRPPGRTLIPVAVISAVFAFPIVLNLVLHWPGQFGLYLTYASSGRAGGHGAATVLRYVLWFWSPYRDVWVAGLVPLAGFAVAAAVTRWLAPARLRRFLTALLAVNAVSSLVFLYYAYTGIDEINQHYVGYFYWSGPVITLLVIVLAVVEAMPSLAGAVAAAAAAVLALAALGVAPQTRTSTDSSDPAVLSSGPNTDPALPGAVATLAARAAGRMIVLRFDHEDWPDITGILVQAERTGVRACVANPIWTVIMTSQFICTNADLATGRVFWLTPTAPRGSTVIMRLRQGVLTSWPTAP